MFFCKFCEISMNIFSYRTPPVAASVKTINLLFYKFLLKWGNIEEDFESSIILEAQKYYFAFESRLNWMIIFATLFRRCPTLWNRRWKWQRCFNVVERCKCQRWWTQRCFNVALTLCDVATSYQPKCNIEPTLKCSLGYLYEIKIGI